MDSQGSLVLFLRVEPGFGSSKFLLVSWCWISQIISLDFSMLRIASHKLNKLMDCQWICVVIILAHVHCGFDVALIYYSYAWHCLQRPNPLRLPEGLTASTCPHICGSTMFNVCSQREIPYQSSWWVTTVNVSPASWCWSGCSNKKQFDSNLRRMPWRINEKAETKYQIATNCTSQFPSLPHLPSLTHRHSIPVPYIGLIKYTLTHG
jgi:hypothetical protein